MPIDDGIEPHWIEEDDWLVTVCMLSDDDRKNNLVTLNWIGRLFGFALATETRTMALVGDPEVPTYEILFSFETPEQRQEFLELVREDGYANPDDGTFTIPTADEIRDARPLGSVFPKEQGDLITNIGAITFFNLTENPTQLN